MTDLVALQSLSTGRCGTTTLAVILDASPDITGFHEPIPRLINEARLAYEGHGCSKNVYFACRVDLIQEVVLKDKKIYAETAPRSTFFAPYMDEFLESKVGFIHLIRDRSQGVRSKIARHAYDGHTWDWGRIYPLDPITAQKWPYMTVEQKNEWSWDETNRWIQEFLNTIEPRRQFYLPFEKLVDPKSGIIPEMFDHFGITPPSQSDLEAILEKKLNANPNLS